MLNNPLIGKKAKNISEYYSQKMVNKPKILVNINAEKPPGAPQG